MYLNTHANLLKLKLQFSGTFQVFSGNFFFLELFNNTFQRNMYYSYLIESLEIQILHSTRHYKILILPSNLGLLLSPKSLSLNNRQKISHSGEIIKRFMNFLEKGDIFLDFTAVIPYSVHVMLIQSQYKIV